MLPSGDTLGGPVFSNSNTAPYGRPYAGGASGQRRSESWAPIGVGKQPQFVPGAVGQVASVSMAPNTLSSMPDILVDRPGRGSNGSIPYARVVQVVDREHSTMILGGSITKRDTENESLSIPPVGPGDLVWIAQQDPFSMAGTVRLGPERSQVIAGTDYVEAYIEQRGNFVVPLDGIKVETSDSMPQAFERELNQLRGEATPFLKIDLQDMYADVAKKSFYSGSKTTRTTLRGGGLQFSQENPFVTVTEMAVIPFLETIDSEMKLEIHEAVSMTTIETKEGLVPICPVSTDNLPTCERLFRDRESMSESMSKSMEESFNGRGENQRDKEIKFCQSEWTACWIAAENWVINLDKANDIKQSIEQELPEQLQRWRHQLNIPEIDTNTNTNIAESCTIVNICKRVFGRKKVAETTAEDVAIPRDYKTTTEIEDGLRTALYVYIARAMYFTIGKYLAQNPNSCIQLASEVKTDAIGSDGRTISSCLVSNGDVAMQLLQRILSSTANFSLSEQKKDGVTQSSFSENVHVIQDNSSFDDYCQDAGCIGPLAMFIPDGICQSVFGKTETGSLSESTEQYLQSSNGALLNVIVQGVCTARTWTHRKDLSLFPRDTVWMLLVAQKVDAAKLMKNLTPNQQKTKQSFRNLAVDGCEFLTKFRWMRATSADMLRIGGSGKAVRSDKKSTVNVTLGENEWIIGGWKIGSVVDTAAARDSANGSSVRYATGSSSQQIVVQTEWFSGDKLSKRYFGNGGCQHNAYTCGVETAVLHRKRKLGPATEVPAAQPEVTAAIPNGEALPGSGSDPVEINSVPGSVFVATGSATGSTRKQRKTARDSLLP